MSEPLVIGDVRDAAASISSVTLAVETGRIPRTMSATASGPLDGAVGG